MKAASTISSFRLTDTEVAIGIDPASPAGRTFDAVLDEITLVPYDGPAARAAVGLQRSQFESGEPIGTVDAMVAGTAISRDEPVVTRNVDELARTAVQISPY